LLPGFVFLFALNGRQDPAKCRWLHIGYSLVILVLGIWDVTMRWAGLIYFGLAILNCIAIWGIEKLGITKRE
jgi:hypothetical protein